MDEFIESVEPQTFELSGLDASAILGTIQFVLIYENKAGSVDFMPFETLKQSFYKALQQFPILAGHIKEAAKGRYSVIVDKSNLNLPDYIESASDIHYSELKAAKFSWDKWPGALEMSSVIDVDISGMIKNVKIQAIRLKDNSGVLISPSIPHGLVDGVGYFTFVNLWAAICKDMRGGEVSSPELQKPVVLDRGILRSSLPDKHKPLDGLTHTLLTSSSLASRYMAWISLPRLAQLATTMKSKTRSETRMFHISKKALERIYESVKDHIPGGMRISDNDLVTALLSKTFAQSISAAARNEAASSPLVRLLNSLTKLLFGWKEKEVLVAMVFDCRHRLGITDANYVGSSVTGLFKKYRQALLDTQTTPESLAAIVKDVREWVNGIDGSYFRGLIDVLDAHPLSHMNAHTGSMQYTSLGLTNQTRFRMYDADFGDGIHQWASFIPGLKYTLAMIQPCPPGVDGINLYVDAPEAVMQSMLDNEFWMGVAQLIY